MQPIHVALGTAGHIDHGKTTLIQALTGVDTDRLPEEKKRGITIVLGFAPLDFPDGKRIGVIDVPGHERFVKNMVAGAGGIDLVLLVVAADEGVMPQTREHVEICDLLGIERGIVALTKIDKAGEELTELAIDDVQSYLEGTALEGVDIVPCSSITKEGIDTLRDKLADLIMKIPERAASPSVVLPVDRMFSVKGFGSVITGTLLQGKINVGDRIEILPQVPGRPTPKDIRVRSVEVFHEKVEAAFAGDRTALSLQGVDLEQLKRGQIIVTPGICHPTRAIDTHIRHLGSRKKPLKTGAKGMFHIGTSLVGVGLTLLDKDKLEPGEAGFARLRLDEPVAALPGQRFILRGFEAVTIAGRTFAGGLVLDPDPPRRKRHTEATTTALEALRQMHRADASEVAEATDAAVLSLVKERGHRGVELEVLARRLGLSVKAVEKPVARVTKTNAIARVSSMAVDAESIARLGERAIELITDFHEQHPFRGGMPLVELTTRLGKSVPPKVAERAAKLLVSKKTLSASQEGYHLPSHKLGAVGAQAKDDVIDAIRAAHLEPPLTSVLEKDTGLPGKALRELLNALAKNGDIVRATPTLFFSKEAFEEAKDKVLAHLDEHGALTTADAKATLGVSRKFLIPLLELMDKQRITVRVGEARKRR